MTDAPLPASALPTLRQLQFLAALAAQGGFVKAADAVGVTQPTLSAGIKELEAVLGVTLVERGRAGAHLTDAGREAAARAVRILSDVEELARVLSGAGAPLTGAFRLGAIPTIAPFLLPKALPALKTRFPKLRLLLREDMTGRLVDALRGRTLDAAIIALPYEAPGVETLAFGEDEFLLACPAQHPLAGRNDLTPDQIQPEELLLLEDGHCLRDHALSVCRATMPGKREAEIGATSLHTVVQMVAAGMGVTLLPRIAAENGVSSVPGLAVQSFNEPVVGRLLGMAWREGSPRAQEARLLAEALREALSPMKRANPVG
jgi:LysR family hydrogen peroxide-inducible transcriptional activator